jgi:hypothetical protein
MRIGTPMSENENWAHGKKKKQEFAKKKKLVK